MSNPDKQQSARAGYFCEEPWTGIFSVQTSGDVCFCPCYAQYIIGNINQDSTKGIWSGEKMVEIRRLFSSHHLPEICADQLCPVVVEGPLPVSTTG